MSSHVGPFRSNRKRRAKSTCAEWLLLGLLVGAAQAKYGGGTGTPEDPYLVYTAEQMNTIGLHQDDWDKHFRLMADIDLSAYQRDAFNRIGFYDPAPSAPPVLLPFSGVFDGNHHTISNFSYVVDAREPLPHRSWRGDEHVGLFGYVSGPQAQIRNLGLIDPNIHPATTCTERVEIVGALVGRLHQGTIEDCYVEGGFIAADRHVGGLVGVSAGHILHCHTTCTVRWAEGRPLRTIEDPILGDTGYTFGGLAGSNSGQISHCHSPATVYGRSSVGGLAGSNSDPGTGATLISDSYATGAVSGDGDVGGLVGRNSGMILNCHATSVVSGGQSVGGLAGYSHSAFTTATIESSHASGRVSADKYVGGLVGGNHGIVQNSYATGQVSGTDLVGGLTGFTYGTVQACYATGEVTGNGQSAGGLSGTNPGTISCCYARGSVLGNDGVGGLVGFSTGTVHHSYATGEVSGRQRVGGLVGNGSGAASDSFWDIETSGCETSASGTGKTTAEMQDFWIYMRAGWDFVLETADGTEDVWRMCCARRIYPKLAWQEVPAGDLMEPEGVDLYDLAFLAEHWLESIPLPCKGADTSFDARVDFKDFTLLAQWWRQGAPKIIYETTLDTDPGWTVEGQWQFGKPAGRGGSEYGSPDPTSGCTGANVYGVNLSGDYSVTADGPHYLTAGPFDCSGCHDVKLQFARWLNTDQADFVDATVEVSNNGQSWTTVWAYAYTQAELTDDAWRTVVYDIGATADNQEQVYIRWGHEVKDAQAWAFSGWNIDDIVLSGLEQ